MSSIERPLTEHVLVHSEHGVFIGVAMGMAFWSKLDTAGQYVACTFPSPEDALDFAGTWDPASGINLDDVEVFATPSGNWRDLLALGLEIADMAHNEAITLQIRETGETAFAIH